MRRSVRLRHRHGRSCSARCVSLDADAPVLLSTGRQSFLAVASLLLCAALHWGLRQSYGASKRELKFTPSTWWHSGEVQSLSSLVKTMQNVKRNPTTLILAERKFNGLGAQFLRLVDAVAYSDAIGADFAVLLERYWNYGCAPFESWSCYLNNTLNFISREAMDSIYPKCVELADINSSNFPRCIKLSTSPSSHIASLELRSLSDTKALQQSRRVASRIWSFNTVTKRHVSEKMHELGLPRNGSYVGLHIRRGDKNKEVPFIPVQQYIEAIDRVVPHHLLIFLSSDDGSVLDEVKALSKRQVLSLQSLSFRRGHNQRKQNRRSMKSNREPVEELLAEIEVLAVAEWFVGTFSSNMGRLVHILRDELPEKSLSLDDCWKPGVAHYTFNLPYCDSNLSNPVYCAGAHARNPHKSDLTAAVFN